MSPEQTLNGRPMPASKEQSIDELLKPERKPHESIPETLERLLLELNRLRESYTDIWGDYNKTS